MCSPCFMDANASSYVHELSIEDIKTIFNNALSFKPQREINILFSGGEPTVSPIFLDAVRHAKGMGFHRLHVATNGVHFAENRDFALQAKEAGLHAVYLQLDGVSEEKNKHRGLGNYMAVKQQALERQQRRPWRYCRIRDSEHTQNPRCRFSAHHVCRQGRARIPRRAIRSALSSHAARLRPA